MPVYNYGDLVERAINSVLAQPVEELELLAINDGSTDNTAEVLRACESRGDARLRVIHQQNAGAGVTRNRGIEQAQGEWLCFLDADDEWLPNALLAIKRLLTDDIDVLLCAYEVESGGRVKEKQPPDASGNLEENFARYINGKLSMSNGPTLIRRKSLGSTIRFADLSQNEDIPFFAQIYATCRVKTTPERLTLIHRHVGSVRSSIDRTRALDVATLVDVTFDESVIGSGLMKYRKDFEVHRLLSTFRRFEKAGARREARAVWFRAFRLSPKKSVQKKYLVKLIRTFFFGYL
jgi:glycosyltransferase involved in cell wall biosynthesis